MMNILLYESSIGGWGALAFHAARHPGNRFVSCRGAARARTQDQSAISVAGPVSSASSGGSRGARFAFGFLLLAFGFLLFSFLFSSCFILLVGPDAYLFKNMKS